GGEYHTYGGGPTDHLMLKVIRVFSWDRLEFEIFWGGASLGTDIADINGAISAHYFYVPIVNHQIEIIFGTLGSDMITPLPDTRYSIIFGMDGNDTIQGNQISQGGQGSRDVIFGGPGDNEI